MTAYKAYLVSLVFVVICKLGFSQISVYNYDDLDPSVRKPELKNISFSRANFGFVPYFLKNNGRSGKSYIGQVYNSPHMSDECEMSDPENDTDLNYGIMGDNIDNKILLVERGSCNFVYKALNAQKLGVQMVIIMDNETHNYKVIMADNGYGYKVTIPAIFVNHQDGLLLEKAIQKSEVLLKVHFNNRKQAKADVTVFLETRNRLSYRLASNFGKYYNMISPYVNLNIAYNVEKCPSFNGSVPFCNENDCYDNGQYCALRVVHEQSANGKEILEEQVEQAIVWKLYPKLWFDFMQQFDEKCSKISEYKDCNKVVMANLGIDVNKIQREYDASFENQPNHYFMFWKNSLSNSGIAGFPGVTINNVTMKGSITAEFVMDDICNSLLKPPEQCKPYVLNWCDIEGNCQMNWTLLILVILAGTAIFGIIFCIYRRHMRKKLKEEMSDKVNDMVSKYIEFYSERNNK